MTLNSILFIVLNQRVFVFDALNFRSILKTFHFILDHYGHYISKDVFVSLWHLQAHHPPYLGRGKVPVLDEGGHDVW